MTRLSFIPAQFVKVAIATRADLAQYVIAGIHVKDGAPGVARAWVVNADTTDGGEITFANEGGKDDTVAVAILPDGSVRLVVSEAVPGGSGTTAQPSVYLVPQVFAPAPACIDQAARDQATAATHIANAAQSNALAAGKQATAATNMVHQANAVNETQAQQIASLDARTAALESA